MKIMGFFFCLLFISPFAHACSEVSFPEFQKKLNSHSRPVTLIFFSTWCSECLVELKKAQNNQSHMPSILIAEHDTLERVNRNLNKLKIPLECYLDADEKIQNFYGIDSIPNQVVLK
jgi:hypothetical protein